MSYNTDSFGNTASGTAYGPYTTSPVTLTTPITYIEGYATGSYVFGIRLWWGSNSLMYGSEHKLDVEDLDCSEDPVYKIEYRLNVSSQLMGIRFTTVSSVLALGYADYTQTAFSNASNVFTNMSARTGAIGSDTVIWGATVYFTGPAPPAPISPHHHLCVAELGWPALAVLAHTSVVAKSLMNVGKLRSRLAIQAPSCDPPLTTSPADAQLWYRTFRAQENCKEMFLIYLPSILIASTLGYHAFGKWVPRAVGTLALVGAFFRHKYLNAYAEDADKREKPFYYASLSMKPIFYLAVVSSGYLVGKELYHTVMERVSNKSSEEGDE